MQGKVLDLVIHHRDAFIFEELLHELRGTEVVFAGKPSHAVHHAVCGNAFRGCVGGIHGPAHHPGRSPAAEVFGNGPVRSNPSRGDEPDDLVNLFEEGRLAHVLFILKFR